jgi:uncharacterized circularly permuted ATP-grasp superfamily protein
MPRETTAMPNFFDEMYFDETTVRPHYREFGDWLARQSLPVIAQKRAEAELIFRRVGITFALNSIVQSGHHENGRAT